MFRPHSKHRASEKCHIKEISLFLWLSTYDCEVYDTLVLKKRPISMVGTRLINTCKFRVKLRNTTHRNTDTRAPIIFGSHALKSCWLCIADSFNNIWPNPRIFWFRCAYQDGNGQSILQKAFSKLCARKTMSNLWTCGMISVTILVCSREMAFICRPLGSASLVDCWARQSGISRQNTALFFMPLRPPNQLVK